jgi:dihydroorotate dehydrogenase electron transfer subunit
MNVQFALAQDVLYVLEANPRASRTVPFVAKATGVPLAKAAARVMLGATIAELRERGLLPAARRRRHLPAHAPMSVKEAVLPFAGSAPPRARCRRAARPGDEVHRRGHGHRHRLRAAFAKSQLAAYGGLPDSGTVFVSVANRDKRAMLFPVVRAIWPTSGSRVLATSGTADVLRRNGIKVEVVRKITERGRPATAPRHRGRAHHRRPDHRRRGRHGRQHPDRANARADGYAIRAAAITADVTLITTVQELAAVQGIESMRDGALRVTSLQEHARALPTVTSSPDHRFSIHAIDPDAGTVEIVVAAHAAGTTWITERRLGDELDLVGPLGQPFPLPAKPGPDGRTSAVLVGGGYGSAPLFWLARVLRQQGIRVEVVLGAASADRLFGVELAGEVADAVEVTTDDGSAGTRGWVSDVLSDVLTRSGAGDVYACGPMAMLKTVSDAAQAAGARAHVAVEEAMACGVGVCMTCVMPVVGPDGRTRMVRSCVEGPVFDGSSGAVGGDRRRPLPRCPADAVGARRQADPH